MVLPRIFNLQNPPPPDFSLLLHSIHYAQTAAFSLDAKKKPSPGEMKNKSASDRQSRKRELDRKSQRLARERTKSHIAHLEALVAHFQETDSDVRSSSLINQLSEAINERDRLRSLLESLNFAIRSQLQETPINKALPSSSTAPKDISTQPPQSGPGVPDSQEANQLASCRLLTETLGGTESLDGNNGNIASYSAESLQTNPLLFELSLLPGSSISTDDATVPQAILPECECMLGTLESTAITLSIWRELNELLKPLPEADLAAEDQESEDVIIRAVLDGWNIIGETGQVPTTCRKLRRFDELAWVQSNPTDRLAILSLMRLMVVSQNSTRQTELPRWLQARPSQKFPHATAIDFVFW